VPEVWYQRHHLLQLEDEVWWHVGERREEAEGPGGGEPSFEASCGGFISGQRGVKGSSLKKNLKPEARRDAVEYLRVRFGLSQRRACSLVGLSRNTLRYVRKPEKDGALRRRMKELALERKRFGCRRLHFLLREEGLVVNHKRTERIYGEEKLSLSLRRRKKVASLVRMSLPRAKGPNQVWAMDFAQDATSEGRRFRIFPIIDTFTRESLVICVDTSIGGSRIVSILDELGRDRGLPEMIMMDNGPEFRSNALDEWAYRRGVKLHFIRPGRPVENAYIESFIGRLRDECLNVHWFLSVQHAREVIERWRCDYNQERPHSSLGGLPPSKFARLIEEKNQEIPSSQWHNKRG